MNRFQEVKLKDQNYLKPNSSVLTNIIEKNKHKKRIFPPSLKTSLGYSKGCQKEFKKVKSLSPTVSEQIDSGHAKESVKLNSTILKLRLDCGNYQDKENMPRNVEDLIKDMKTKVELIDKQCGSSVSNKKIREFITVFDEFSNFFNDFRFFLSKFKRLFEQIYLKNILLQNEIDELKESLKKSEDSEKFTKNFAALEENPLKKVRSEGNFIKIDPDLCFKRIPLLKRQSHVSVIKNKVGEDLNFSKIKLESKVAKEAQKDSVVNRVPKLPVNGGLIVNLGFQDEFMENFDNFSESWRNLIEEQKRYE